MATEVEPTGCGVIRDRRWVCVLTGCDGTHHYFEASDG